METKDVQLLIQIEYQKLLSAKFYYEKLNIINSVIGYRVGFKVYNIKELYMDVKKYILYYFEAIDEVQGDFYEFDEQKIIEIVEYLPITERVKLYEYANRITKIGAFEDYNKWVNNELNKNKIKYYLNKKDFKSLVLAVGCITSYNFLTIILSLCILFSTMMLILLPTDNPNFVLFDIKYDSYYTNFSVNHVLNLLAYIFQLGDDFSITPKTFTGLLVLIIIKVLTIGILFNYLAKEFSKKL